MKKAISAVLAAIMILSLFPSSTAFASPTDGLILYYSFDNGAVADVGENAQGFNVSFSSTDCVSNSAVFLDGNSSYLQLPSDLNKSLDGDFTISTWAKFNSLNYWMRIFDFGANDKSYAFLGLSAPNDVRYAHLTDKSGVELNVSAVYTVFENTWTHFTIVRENKVMKLYVNGALVTQTDDFGDNCPADIDNSLNYIGKSQFSQDPYFHGYIDEFKVFDTALSKEGIVENMIDGVKEEFSSYAPMHAQLFDGKEIKDEINLVSFTTDTASLSWASSDEGVISHDGTVTRCEEDKTVTLTATVQIGEAVNKFTYTLFVPSATNVNAEIYIDSKKKGVDINPDMIGLFFEDINYAADGGLYAELVQNRSFEAVNAQWDAVPDPISDYAWDIKASDYAFSKENPLNENNTTYLKLKNPSSLDSFSNNCYEGFPVVSGENFDFSVFLRINGEYKDKIMITLTDGDRIVGRTFLEDFNSEWTKYESKITTVSSARSTTLKITVLGSMEGSIDFDMVSLFPQATWMNRKNGLRADLVQMLKDLHPGFLRFPGGCIIEGHNLSNRYSWKDTVGPVEERKENWNRWQLHTGGDGRYAYCQSYGLGFYEYFLLCEDIGAFPLPVVNVGIGCQYQTGDVSSMEDLYSIYIRDALDLIEFANGNVDTTWGSLRAKMGHPEPFNLEYIGIGNEQWETDKVNFFERYEAFEREIHNVYPDIKLIATSGPDASGAKFDAAWEFLKSHCDKGEENFAYAVDEHYYRTPDWFYTNLDRYDNYDRNGYKAFPGEYASRYSQSKEESNMNCALSVAAYMTSLEKNADIVTLASYAPLFSRDGYTQWYPDLIGFNSSVVYPTPDYYVQSMYSNNKGSYTVENRTVNHDNNYTPHGRVGISTWTTSARFYDLKITDNITGETIELGDPILTGSGSWDMLGGEYAQTDSSAQAPALLFGTEDMENYTFSLKAKKVSGTEGFLIPVLWEDEQNYYTCNIGGWGNTYCAIQRTENGNTYELSVQNTAVKINANQEYEIKVTVEPHKLTCYLDGEEVNFVSFRQNVYSTSSYDEKTGDIIVKAVNTTGKIMETAFTINADYINPIAHVIELSTDDVYKTNSAENTSNVAPIKFEADVSDNFTYNLPPNSFTVFRIHTKDSNEVIAFTKTAEIQIDKGDELILPDTVTVTYLDNSTSDLTVTWDIIPDEFTLSSGTKTVEGTVDGTNTYAHVNVIINETDKAIVTEPTISYNMPVANFSVNFSNGKNDNSVFAVAAAFNEEGIMTMIAIENLTPEKWECSIDITDFLSEHRVKLFMFNNFNYIVDSVTVK